jgi:hypothetical protein
MVGCMKQYNIMPWDKGDQVDESIPHYLKPIEEAIGFDMSMVVCPYIPNHN